jgi:hypothetical protein
MMMNKHKIVARGYSALIDIERHPDDYEAMLGGYVTDGLISNAIQFFTLADPDNGASHVSIVFVHKGTGTPVAEVQALNKFGVVPTVFAAVAKDSTVITIRRVQGVRPVSEILSTLSDKLGKDYQKPFHFVTKKRGDNPNKWFCSELANSELYLQCRPDVYVSPVWCMASPVAQETFGVWKNGHFDRVADSSGSA